MYLNAFSEKPWLEQVQFAMKKKKSVLKHKGVSGKSTGFPIPVPMELVDCLFFE